MSSNTITEIQHTWQRRKQIGTRLAIRKIGSLINDTGISAAGDRSLPLYWLVGYFVTPILLLILQALLSTVLPMGGLISGLLNVAGGIILLAAWPFSALILHWDCLAAERYADLSFSFGKVIALTAIVLGPAAVVFYLLYRIVKFS